MLLGLLLAVVGSGVLIVGFTKTRAEEERGRQLFRVLSGIRNYAEVGPEREAGCERVERHAAAIATIRSLVSQRCRIPPELEADPDDGLRWRHSSSLMNAANLLSLAALEAASRRRFDEAAELWLDRIRLGQVGYRGGRAFRSAGLHCAMGGWPSLQRLAGRLTAEQCRTVLKQAIGLEPAPVLGQNVALRDARQEWLRGWHGPGSRESLGVRWENATRRARQAYDGVLRWEASEDNLVSGPRERALVSLALRAFVLEHGRGPTNLTEVVPAYLPTAPESDSLRAKLGGG